jgi:uncharacterized repeat protein (TIGR01451 family)
LSVEELEDRTVPSATLVATLSAPPTATAGSSLVSHVTLTNIGPGTAANVNLDNTLPSGITLLSQVQVSGPAFTLGTNSGAPHDTISSLANGVRNHLTPDRSLRTLIVPRSAARGLHPASLPRLHVQSRPGSIRTCHSPDARMPSWRQISDQSVVRLPP